MSSFGGFNFGEGNFNGESGGSVVVGQYPTPDIGGPVWTTFVEQKPEFQVLIQQFEDGGADYNLSGTEPILRWRFYYGFLTEEEASILDSHNFLASDSTYPFSFRNPRTGVLYTGCHYEQFDVGDREKKWLSNRTIMIVKRPGE